VSKTGVKSQKIDHEKWGLAIRIVATCKEGRGYNVRTVQGGGARNKCGWGSDRAQSLDSEEKNRRAFESVRLKAQKVVSKRKLAGVLRENRGRRQYTA